MKKETTQTLKFGAYMRKSTDDKEKQILSLEKQEEIIERLVRAHDLHIVEDPIVEKKSAKVAGRPGFNKMVSLIKAGKINAIVTWSAHRLSRNAEDTGTLVTLMDKGLLKEIVTDNQIFRRTPIDTFMFGFLCAQAKLENDTKAIDIREGMIKVAGNGIFPNCPPLGYLPDKYGIKGMRKREIDPINFPLVRKMWDLMLMGTHTPYQIMTKATNEWGLRTRIGKKPAACTIYAIFHNTFYYGEFEYPKGSGNVYKSNHQPMITKAEFQQVQRMFRRTDNPRPINNYFSFGGCSLHCDECGCAIVGMNKIKKLKNGDVGSYIYYGCTKKRGACSQPPVTEKELTDGMQSLLTDLQMFPCLHDYMMAWVRRENDKQFEGVNAEIESNKKVLSSCQKKRVELTNMRASGLINDAEFQECRVETDNEIKRVTELINNFEQNTSTWIGTADKLFTFMELAALRFKTGSPETQRGILHSLGWKITLKQKQLELSGGNWVEPIKLIVKKVNDELPRLEPVLSIYTKDKIDNLLDNSVLCSLLEDVKNSFLNNPDSTTFPIVDEWRRDIPEG